MTPSFEHRAESGQPVAPPAGGPSLDTLKALVPVLVKMKKQGLTAAQAFEKLANMQAALKARRQDGQE